MIAAMRFGDSQRLDDGRRVRLPAFAPLSTLPLSAACVVANGVRERLSRLLAVELEVELLEPAIPSVSERRTLVESATIFRVRGRLTDAFVIARPADARRLVALAFGESDRSERDALSAIERTTLERVVSDLVPLCNALCGTLGPVTRESPERAIRDVSTYFEVRTLGTPQVAVGFALADDPREEVDACLQIDELGEVEIEARVEVAAGVLGIPGFARLAPGRSIPLETRLGASGVLHFGDVAFARVTCGVSNGRNAATLDARPGETA